MADVKPGYIAEKQAHLNRLKRIEGQVRGIQRMVDEETYCIDILTQISAATKALETVALSARRAPAPLCQPRRARRRQRGRREDHRGLGRHRAARPFLTPPTSGTHPVRPPGPATHTGEEST